MTTSRPRPASVAVLPGQTSGTVPVPYEADELDDLPRQVQAVHAVARHGLAMSRYVGHAEIRDDDDSPAVSFEPVRRRAHYGDDLVVELRLSDPIDYWEGNRVRAIRVDWWRPLRTSDVPRSWIRAQLGDAPDDVPLARVWRYGYIDLPPGTTRGRLVVPTREHPLHRWTKALTVRLTTRHLSGPLRATVVVRMRR